MTVSLPKTDTPLQVPPALAPPGAEPESFVINLCSSTTPMALTQPKLAQLKDFTFFVSRRLEDGRERFRLHMGYFDSLLQAEELLPTVRDVYPGAWAGEAPGKRLRARAAVAKAAPPVAPAAAKPQPVAAKPAAVAPAMAAAKPVEPAKPAKVPLPARDTGPTAEMLANMPTLAAAPELAPVHEPDATRIEPALTLELVAEPPRSAPSELPSEPAAPAVAAAPPKVVTRPGGKRNAAIPFDKRSNVREVLSSLDETARAPAPTAVPKASAAPALPAGPAVRQPGVLPEAQVLHLLEQKRGDPLNTVSTPAAFSIQLQWSVQPIDLAKVPPLAIFGAYTLYTVEGSREGRRWFGLRLGFFSDANSAKQVAQYVRSEFSSVAVVPVSLKERDGASGATGLPGAQASDKPQDSKTTERLPERTGEFKLLDASAETPRLPAATPKPAAAGKPVAARAGQKSTKGRGNRVNAHEKRGPKTLEETLEILGADDLQIEGAKRKELVSEGGVRHMDVKVQRNSPFSRLLDKLAERNR
jgi:hypothetical protein